MKSKPGVNLKNIAEDPMGREEPFLTKQPVWRLDYENSDDRWTYGVLEDDPISESEDSIQIQRVKFDDDPGDPPKLTKVDRSEFVTNAMSSKNEWKLVALVCGAGLGENNQPGMAGISNQPIQGLHGRATRCLFEIVRFRS